MAPRDPRENRATKVFRAYRGSEVPRAYRVYKARPGLSVPQARRVRPEPPAPPDLRESPALLVLPVLKGLKATREKE